MAEDPCAGLLQHCRTAAALTGSAGVSPAGLITLGIPQRFLVIGHGRGLQRCAGSHAARVSCFLPGLTKPARRRRSQLKRLRNIREDFPHSLSERIALADLEQIGAWFDAAISVPFRNN